MVVFDYINERALVNYYHDDARRHFVGAGDALGAQYVNPLMSHSHIVQPTSSMLGGRHLLVYESHYHCSDNNNKCEYSVDEE